MKCKNKECLNDTIGKRIYCSLTCRNYYVNKYLRDYNKTAETLKNIYKDKYLPNKCKLCEEYIPYENRKSDYCSKKCSKKTININRKGLKYKLSESGLKNLRLSASKNFKIAIDFERINNYNENPNKCNYCFEGLTYDKRKLKFCCEECRKEFRRKDMTEFNIYKSDSSFNFNLSDYPDEFNFELINEHGWYSPSNKNNNLNGVSRDHMYSVNKGFKNKIDPKIISHPANCKLMIHNDNISKNNKCSITIEDLLTKIDNWDKKYN